MKSKKKCHGGLVNHKGFTLVELIVVIVILTILAALLIPGLLKWIDKAREKKYEMEARNIYLATEASLVEAYARGFEDSDSQLAGHIDSGHYTIPNTTGYPNRAWFEYIKALSGIDTIEKIVCYTKEGELKALSIEYISPSDNKKIRATINEIGYDFYNSGYPSWKADDGKWHFEEIPS